MIAKGDTYPTAMLIVFKLTAATSTPTKAIKHGNADAELSENFKKLNASTDNFKGFPSSMIEGSYDLNGKRMHSYNRIVIATGAPPGNQRYLVQFTVTGYADKAQARGARHRSDHRRVQRRQEIAPRRPRLGCLP